MRSAVIGPSEGPRHPPVVANQEPVALVTKMIGAMQGCGSVSTAWMTALPPPAVAGPVVAVNGSVRAL